MSVLHVSQAHLLLSLQFQIKATLSASSQNLATFTGTVVLEVLNVHGTGHKCDISDSPSSVVTGRENVPTVSLVWASTHHYTRHSAFSNDYYWCGTSGFGEKLDWTFGVDYFSRERAKEVVYSFI